MFWTSWNFLSEHFLKYGQQLITARKGNLRRLCFYTCMSFCPQGGVPGQVLPVRYTPGRYAPGQGTPQAGTPRAGTTPRQVPPRQVHPPKQVHPLGRYTPLGRYSPRQVPPGRYPSWAGTPPWAGSPPATVHAGIQSTSGRYASYWNAFLLNYKNSSNVLNRHFAFQTKKEYTFIIQCSCHKDRCSFTFGEHLVFLSHYNSQTQKAQGLHLKFLI